MVRLAEAELFTDESGSIHLYRLQLEKEAKGVTSVPSLPSNQHFPSIHLPPSTVPIEGEEEGGEGDLPQEEELKEGGEGGPSTGGEGKMIVEM